MQILADVFIIVLKSLQLAPKLSHFVKIEMKRCDWTVYVNSLQILSHFGQYAIRNDEKFKSFFGEQCEALKKYALLLEKIRLGNNLT